MWITVKGTPAQWSKEDSVSRPRLPQYKEREDIATYFTRFERVTALFGEDDATYAVRFGCLLTGKRVDIYISSPSKIIYSHRRWSSGQPAGVGFRLPNDVG